MIKKMGNKHRKIVTRLEVVTVLSAVHQTVYGENPFLKDLKWTLVELEANPGSYYTTKDHAL